MSGKTTIEWTWMPGYEGASWNPTTGCTRVSAGCDNCYAFALHDKRHKANRDAAHTWWGRAPTRRLVGDSLSLNGMQQARLNGAAMPYPKQYDLPFSRVQLLPDRLDAPLRKKRPTCWFVDSMADLFHEDIDDGFLDLTFATMGSAHWHTFLVLTKRPERMRHYSERSKSDPRWPYPNIWLGTSVEDQRSADERIPHLLATPAAVRFLSCEPLLGPISLSVTWFSVPIGDGPEHMEGIDWVIIGGESGSRARPMDLAWARSLVEQCRAAGVAVFVKQMGSNPVGRTVAFTQVEPGDYHGKWATAPLKLRETHGRDMAEWPEDLRVREWPQ